MSQTALAVHPLHREDVFWGASWGFPGGWFLLAKWRTAEQETRHNPALTPSDVWDVVYVFQDGDDERQRDFLRVRVVGVEGAQSIENFEWGPGPITPLAISLLTQICTHNQPDLAAGLITVCG